MELCPLNLSRYRELPPQQNHLESLHHPGHGGETGAGLTVQDSLTEDRLPPRLHYQDDQRGICNESPGAGLTSRHIILSQRQEPLEPYNRLRCVPHSQLCLLLPQLVSLQFLSPISTAII